MYYIISVRKENQEKIKKVNKKIIEAEIKNLTGKTVIEWFKGNMMTVSNHEIDKIKL